MCQQTGRSRRARRNGPRPDNPSESMQSMRPPTPKCDRVSCAWHLSVNRPIQFLWNAAQTRFYQALALISDLQIVANLFREDVISIHPAATDTDNSRFLFWSLNSCRCALKGSNRNGMQLVEVWSDQLAGLSWDKNRKLLLVCKQWWLECGCCNVVSSLIRQHFLIKGIAKSGTKERRFFGLGQNLVKHRWGRAAIFSPFTSRKPLFFKQTAFTWSLANL